MNVESNCQLEEAIDKKSKISNMKRCILLSVCFHAYLIESEVVSCLGFNLQLLIETKMRLLFFFIFALVLLSSVECVKRKKHKNKSLEKDSEETRRSKAELSGKYFYL